MRAPDLGPATWRKSSRTTDNDNCVEIADLPDETVVRDSKAPEGAAFAFDPSACSAFLSAVKTGQLNRWLPGQYTPPGTKLGRGVRLLMGRPH